MLSALFNGGLVDTGTGIVGGMLGSQEWEGRRGVERERLNDPTRETAFVGRGTSWVQHI